MAVASIPVKGTTPTGLWRVFQWILERHHDNAYGEIRLRMQAGRIVMVDFHHSQKPDALEVKDTAAGQKHFAGLPY